MPGQGQLLCAFWRCNQPRATSRLLSSTLVKWRSVEDGHLGPPCNQPEDSSRPSKYRDPGPGHLQSTRSPAPFQVPDQSRLRSRPLRKRPASFRTSLKRGRDCVPVSHRCVDPSRRFDHGLPFKFAVARAHGARSRSRCPVTGTCASLRRSKL
jgi:hypothetical protein